MISQRNKLTQNKPMPEFKYNPSQNILTLYKIRIYLLVLVGVLAFCSCRKADCSTIDATCNPILAYLLYQTPLKPSISIGPNGLHTCMLLSDRSIRCWGRSTLGQLGYNNTTPVGNGAGLTIIEAGSVPVGATVSQIIAGNTHTCAVFSNGTLRCWGDGSSGKLGYNNVNLVGNGIGVSIITAGDVPVGGFVTQVAAGNTHTCALLNNGAVRCWGLGTSGQLGYNNANSVGNGVGISIEAAGDVPVGGTVKQIEVGTDFTCALLTSGNVRCWGFGNSGRLGYNDTLDIGDGGAGGSIISNGDVPIGGKVKQIASGSSHTCALLENGVMRCWGNGNFGKLGYNNTLPVGNSVPTSIAAAGDVPTGGSVSRVETGNDHTCAIYSDSTLRCWGSGTLGRLGYNNTTAVGGGVISIVGAGNINTGSTVAQVAAGSTHSCALLDNAKLYCWGGNANGELGYNNTNQIADGIGLSILEAGNVPVYFK